MAGLAPLVGMVLRASALAVAATTSASVEGIGVKLIDPPVSSLTNPFARTYCLACTKRCRPHGTKP